MRCCGTPVDPLPSRSPHKCSWSLVDELQSRPAHTCGWPLAKRSGLASQTAFLLLGEDSPFHRPSRGVGIDVLLLLSLDVFGPPLLLFVFHLLSASLSCHVFFMNTCSRNSSAIPNSSISIYMFNRLEKGIAKLATNVAENFTLAML